MKTYLQKGVPKERTRVNKRSNFHGLKHYAKVYIEVSYFRGSGKVSLNKFYNLATSYTIK